MPLATVNTSTTVYATAPSGQTGYNDIRASLVDILGTGSNGYGYQSIPSSTVSTTNNISAQNWNNLTSNLSLIQQHLFNTTPTFTNVPVSGQVIRDNFVNQLVSILNTAEPVRYNRPPAAQRSTYNAASQWTVNSPSRLTWGALIEHEITLTWSSVNEARYFFNLGGRLSFNLVYPVEPYNPGDLEWKALIDANVSNFAAFIYTRSDYLAGNKSTVWADVNGNSIDIIITKVSGQQIKMLVSLSNTQPATNLEVTNTFSYEYSTGAINAPQPTVTVQKSLGDTTVPIFVPVKILSVTTPTAYTFVTGQTSAAQTVSVTNNGNTTTSVSSITFSNASGITQVTNFTGLGGTTTFTLTPSQTKTFTLAYTGSNIGGPYNSSFTVNSDNDAGPITIQTSQTINNVPFSITLSPTSVTESHVGFGLYSKVFTIVSNNGEPFTWSSSLGSVVIPSGATGFSQNPTTGNQDNTVSLIFDPTGASAPTYTASCTFTINATATSGSDTKSATITINGSLPTSANLGTWLSPQAPDNSVIGMSYDIIDGERYLTIGVGMGANGSVPLNEGGSGNVFVSNLGAGADPSFRLGQPLFLTTIQGSWNTFLRTFGVWPTSTPSLPENVDVGITPTYLIHAQTSGTYTFQYNSDDDSDFYFVPCDQYGIWDGVSDIISLPNQLMTGGAQSNWNTSYTGSVTLNAGYYLLKFYLKNYGGPAAGAFQLSDPSGNVIWNTLSPVRSDYIYPFWQEVMRFRIPADGTARTIYSFYKYVKNSYQVGEGYHWGYYFDGGLFKVIDDGVGNLTIQFFGEQKTLSENMTDYLSVRETMRSLPMSFYYYIPPDVLTRYTNLDPGPVGDGTQTTFFTGFDRNGNVTTVLTTIPSVAPYPRFYIPGSGDGGGNLPVFRDGELIRPPAEN